MSISVRTGGRRWLAVVVAAIVVVGLYKNGLRGAEPPAIQLKTVPLVAPKQGVSTKSNKAVVGSPTIVAPGTKGQNVAVPRPGSVKVPIADLAAESIFTSVEGLSPSPLYRLRMHAIRVADTDGKRQAQVTPALVKKWVDQANQIFAASNVGIQLVFDPSTSGPDWETLNNTTINSLSSGAGPWKEANERATKYPGKVVFFFRFGPDPKDPTGNGFAFPPQSGIETNFVAMPGFDTSGWNPAILAHEFGHYVGLYHTFPGWSDDVTDTTAKAADYTKKNGNLDGDGLSDTPDDAGTAFYGKQGWNQCDPAHASYTIAGRTITPNRTNFMSYFNCGSYVVSPMQVSLMRQTLQTHSLRKKLILPGSEIVFGKTIVIGVVRNAGSLPYSGKRTVKLTATTGGATTTVASAVVTSLAPGKTFQVKGDLPASANQATAYKLVVGPGDPNPANDVHQPGPYVPPVVR